jgi:type VI secretion system protein ImpC
MAEPMRILVSGDFGGPRPRPRPWPKPIFVDRDNFDEVLADAGVTVRLPGLGPGESDLLVPIHSLDDFHPDQLWQQVPIFGQLRDWRYRLDQPQHFEQAAVEVRQTLAPTSAPPPATAALANAAAGNAAVSDAGLLDQIIGASSPQPASVNPLTADVQRWLAAVVNRYALPAERPDHAELVRLVKRAGADLMRCLLHHERFMAVEAAWRGLYWLVKRLPTGTHLKLYCTDLSRDELADDLLPSSDLTTTQTYRQWVQLSLESAQARPWDLVIGLYSFTPTEADAAFIGRLMLLAELADCAVVADASLDFVAEPADEPAASAWRGLRQLPESARVGLVLPRLMLRVPYGREGSSVEALALEENEPDQPEHYLWGSGALTVGVAVGEAFARVGRDGLSRSIHGRLDDLPVAIAQRDGQRELVPPTEATMTEDTVNHILERGLMPLWAMAGRNAAWLPALVGLREPLAALRGRWS